MSLTKKVYLTISGYDIKLSDNLTFYQKDQLKLIFYINEYGIDYENNATTRALMPVNPLNAILFIENPDGVDSVSSARIEDNAVTFYLDSTHTQYVGVSRMQLRLFDQDGCAITLPHFTFEIRENIYGSGDVRFQNVVMVDQTGTVILTEDNDLLDVGDILTMGTEVAYPQVTKTIKELPVKNNLDGTEKLIVEDDEATKQAPLGTIVDEIKQNSQEKIREIESGLAQTNAQLSETKRQLSSQLETNIQQFNNSYIKPHIKKFSGVGDGVNDDTQAIKDFLAWYETNMANEFIDFPRGIYKVSSTIIIPERCRRINFNGSVFKYVGDDNTYCISGGANSVNDSGWLYPVWSDLVIECNNKLNNGINFTRIRNGIYSNIKIQNANIGIKMDDSWASDFKNTTIYNCNIGIKTGRACNGVNISKADIESCGVGIEIGNEGEVTTTWGSNGVFIDNGTLIQKCVIAIDLHFVKKASAINSYFEHNDITLRVANIANKNYDIKHFSLKDCIVDCGSNDKECMIYIEDNTRPFSMNISDNTIIGRFTNKLIKVSGENIQTGVRWLKFTGNVLSGLQFTSIFPNNFRFNRLETDIAFVPRIDTQWVQEQPVKIYCKGNGIFTLYGSVKRKDTTGTNSVDKFITGIPYYMLHDTYKSDYLVPQKGDGNSNHKNAKLIVTTFNSIDLFTEDTSDLNKITLNGISWQGSI